jgi:hypothetical protein
VLKKTRSRKLALHVVRLTGLAHKTLLEAVDMVAILEFLWRVLSGIAGVLLVYSSLFLYEPEEGGLQNVLEQWWIKIRDLHAKALSRETAFLKIVVAATGAGLARVFGKRLMGPKAVAASLCYSQAAILLSFALVDQVAVGVSSSSGSDPITTSAFLLLSIFFLVLGSSGPFIERGSRKVLWLSVVTLATALWLPLYEVIYGRFFHRHVWGPNTSYLPMACTLPFAVGCDFLFVVVTRLMLARAALFNRFIQIAAFALLNVSLAALFVVGPPVLVIQFGNGFPNELWQPLMMLLGFSNLLLGLVSLAWVFVALTMLLHRACWPVIERPVYAVYRYRLFSEHKKLVFFSGVGLLGLAIPSVGDAIEKIVKAIHI